MDLINSLNLHQDPCVIWNLQCEEAMYRSQQVAKLSGSAVKDTVLGSACSEPIRFYFSEQQ